ncbi:hypothetical protein STIAU_5286 [Stigmatella aurantiaca DW4/3-1]|uniref:Peptidase M61 catalytic domain-containing protein n=1 Tax=Stigmatella aurantiaca (strain DW4/3-1) TaxID=378806 RepID=Q090N2_STIAD|nr:hypothetical protein STIAU_5286 [Stigmatella aurantiaca DW4/3-1]
MPVVVKLLLTRCGMKKTGDGPLHRLPRRPLRLSSLLAIILSLSACGTVAPRLPPPRQEAVSRSLRYHVTYVREPGHALEVEVGLDQPGEQEFLFTQPGGVKTVWAFRDPAAPPLALPVQGGSVRLPRGTHSLRYRYPLDEIIRERGPGFFTGMGRGDARYLAGKSWLLRPRVASPSRRVELWLEGANALLPWVPAPEGHYVLTAADLVDSGFHSFGGHRCQARLPGAVLDVAILAPMRHLGDAAVCDWLGRTAGQLLTVRRTFPYPRVAVHVVPVEGDRTPNLFGMLMWSTPPSISLLVGQEARPEALEADWAALHEMLHLLHPAFVPRTPWISEGLATYFTELARARSGRHPPERAWAELLRGFERGREQAAGRTLEEMIEEDAPPGIYWVGAYLALLLDVELRRATQHQRGLEDVLAFLAGRGATSTPAAYGAAVDAVAGRPFFEEWWARRLREPAFAGLEGLLEALGVTLTPGGIQLRPARDSLLRESLEARSASGPW